MQNSRRQQYGQSITYFECKWAKFLQTIHAGSVMRRCGQHRVTRDTWRVTLNGYLLLVTCLPQTLKPYTWELWCYNRGRRPGLWQEEAGGVPSIPGISPRPDGSHHCSTLQQCPLLYLALNNENTEGWNTADSKETLYFHLSWAVAQFQCVVATKKATKRAASSGWFSV